MAWYESKHVVVTGPSVVTRCVWRVFIDVFAKGANLIPPSFQFQSLPVHRFPRSRGSLPPNSLLSEIHFSRDYLLYPEDGGKSSSQMISIYQTAWRHIFLKFMDRTISTFARKSLLQGVGYSLSAETMPVWRHSKGWIWELRRGILRPVVEGLLQDVSRPRYGLTLKGQWCNGDNTHCYNLQFGRIDAFVFKRIRLVTNVDSR